MRLPRAVHHVRTLAEACSAMAGSPATIFPLRVERLWVWGDLLDGPGELEAAQVALAVDLPVEEVAWHCEPPGSRHWADATRLSRVPLLGWWRSTRAPVWNHAVVRPVLVWDLAGGVREEALQALAEGRAEPYREPAPAADALRERLEEERAVSLAHLRAATATYDDRRWAPGKTGPYADALWRASWGYLDVLDAVQQPRSAP